MTGEEARADRLVSELSHELHTPLALIVGYAELLQIRTDEVTRRDAPTRILEAAERLAAAMDTLLVVLALDAGWLSVEPTPVNLETALAGLSPAVDGSAFVLVDEEHLGRILQTLLAIGPGPADVRIAERAGVASIAILNAGIELSEAQLEQFFDRAAPAGLPVRSVLDAYIARMLVELHGGAISAEAVAGKGLRIVFTLPLAPEASR